MLFLVACAGTRIIPVPEDVQREVQEVIESKHYNMSFYQTYLKDLSNNYLRSSGDLYVCGDSLGYRGEALDYTFYRLTEYRHSKNESGEMLVTLSGERYESGKKISISFRLKIRTLENIEVLFNKTNYNKGKIYYNKHETKEIL